MTKLPSIPLSFARDQIGYLRNLSTIVDKAISERIGRNVPTDQVLLVSPEKKVYALSVADDGTITTTLVQG